MAYGNEKSDKRWEIRSIQVAQPAAGAEWSVTVPAGQVWRLLMAFSQFTASGTVANRFPGQLKITDGVNILGQICHSVSVAAGGIVFVTLARGIPIAPANNNSNILLALPDAVVLPPGSIISTTTNGIQTGDQYSIISLLVESADAD